MQKGGRREIKGCQRGRQQWPDKLKARGAEGCQKSKPEGSQDGTQGNTKEPKRNQGRRKDTKSARNLDCQRRSAADNPNWAPKVAKRDATREPRETKRKRKGAKGISKRRGKGTKSARNLDCRRKTAADNPNLAPKVAKRGAKRSRGELKGTKKKPKGYQGKQKGTKSARNLDCPRSKRQSPFGSVGPHMFELKTYHVLLLWATHFNTAFVASMYICIYI